MRVLEFLWPRVKGTPTCRLTPSGITIDMHVAAFSLRHVAIDVPFARIYELETFTYIEAATFTEIGPNANDLRRFLKGRIPRPTVLHHVRSVGKTLLVRGRNLFYLITVDREGIEDVLHAFAAFRARAPLPPRAAAALP